MSKQMSIEITEKQGYLAQTFEIYNAIKRQDEKLAEQYLANVEQFYDISLAYSTTITPLQVLIVARKMNINVVIA